MQTGYFSEKNFFKLSSTAQNIKSRCTEKIDLITLFTTTINANLELINIT